MAWTIKRGNIFYIGWNDGTKDKYESTRSSDPAIAETRRLEKELHQTVSKGAVAQPLPEMSLETLIELYKKEADIKENTHRINKYSWGKFKLIIGDKPIGDYSTADVKRFKDTLLAQEAAHASISLYLRDLNKLFGFAVEKALIKMNPCKRPGNRKWAIEHPEEENTFRFLTQEEEAHLLAVCNPILIRMVKVGLGTGLRISQVVEMDWKRYDAKTRLYIVPKQKRQKARHIPIFGPTLEAMGALHLGGRVFPGTNKDQIEKMFHRAVKNSKIGGECTFHDLRHTFVSRVCNYLSPVEVRDLMGWSSVALVDRYTHSRVTDIQAKMAISQNQQGVSPVVAHSVATVL